jgi:dihydroorotate dehydrogenase electron transfer subunit
VADPLRTDAEVVAIRREGPSGRRLTLRVDGWPGFGPGQFVMLSPGAVASVPRTDPLLPRPMAVYRESHANGAAQIEILFKVSGRGTALLAEVVAGERVALVGPLGRSFEEPATGERALLVAGGTGIASVYELAARLRAVRPGPLVLLGARRADDLMGATDFELLGVELHVATEDGSAGREGLVTELLEAALAEDGRARVYACGPTPMMRRASELAAASGRPCVVSLENTMACGFGVCLGCAAPLVSEGFRLVCRDGPMFDAAELDWERLP